MAASIVDTIAQSISSGLIPKLSTMTGETASNLETGLGAAIRAMTASVAMRANDPDAIAQIHSMAVDPANDLSLPDRADGLVSRVIGSSGSSASDFIQSLLLGNRFSNMSDSLASYAGVSSATAKSLFGIATSLVLSYLGKMVRTDGLDPAGLSKRLATEGPSIMAGLPPALSKFYPSVGETARDVSATLPSAAAAAASRAGTTGQRRSALTWAMPVALAALAIWALSGLFNSTRAPEQARNDSVPRAVGTSGFVNNELPDGVKLRFSPNGTEARLLALIRGSAPATRAVWFEFDRLQFETDSAVLKSGSTEQLSNIAAILKAYPAAAVKIGGYTDNTGDAGANVRLSQMRAEAVRDQLQRMGIDPSRLAAEGYGGEHPVADNNTAAGRAQNRRVAIRVTAK